MYIYNLGLKFEHTVKKYPRNTALQFKQSINYTKLNKTANQIAGLLLKKGIEKHDVVCISGIKNTYTYATMIACLKIGAVYSILDNNSPIERLERIINTCTPKVLFINKELKQKLHRFIKQKKYSVILNDEILQTKLEKYQNKNLALTKTITGTNPAYIMFTSGSTGFPKGALMTHQNLLNLIQWSVETFTITPKDRLTNVNPLYFDNSVFDFSSSLFTGATLVPVTQEIIMKPYELVKLIDTYKCTIWFSVPSLLIYLNTAKALNKNTMKSITRFIFGGEGYPKPKLKLLFNLYSNRAGFFNVYGPTECTCICSSYKVTRKDFKVIEGLPPLGLIANNFSFLLLDHKGQKVNKDESGELFLLGPNVGKGYFNDKKRTEERFVQNPFNKSFYEIMYRTGDLVKLNSKNNLLYFVGRTDNQIKHMGYRIELEEIEAALHRLPYVSQAAVIHGYVNELSQIIAFISTKLSYNQNIVKKDVRKMLPHYMVPNKILIMTQLPKNANGKIDKKNLETQYFKQ